MGMLKSYAPLITTKEQGKLLTDGYLLWMLNNFPEWPTLIARKQQSTEIYSVYTLLKDLKLCSMKKDMQLGRRIHVRAVESQHDSNIYVVTALMRMYGKCGSMVDARRLFDSIQKPDVVSWNVLLMGYADNSDELAALQMFSEMKDCGCTPTAVTYVAAIKACTSLAGTRGQVECLNRGRQIHSEIGCDLDIFVQSTLIDMYAKCGSMLEARQVFESMQMPNVVPWSTLLMGYVENGDGRTALELFAKMKACGCAPNSVTFVAVLKACTLLAGKQEGGECLKWGREIHSEIGCDMNIFVQSMLIDMYANCGSIQDARRVFDSIQRPDVVCWNALLLGYAENGDGLSALELFRRMNAAQGCTPNSVTYVAVLKACASLSGKRDDGECLIRVREIHSQIGSDLDIFVQNTLIDMYANCGGIVDARRVFDSIREPDVVSWNSLLMGYVENGDGLATLKLYSKMKLSGCAANSVTYVATLKACALVGALVVGQKIHSEITEFTAHVVTCLVDFYAKCGSIIKAREVFDAHSRESDVSTWTALLTGYGSFGDTVSVFNLFKAMQDQGIKPDAVTFVCMLSCCSHAGLIEKAREYLAAMPALYGITPTVMHYNCMIDILGRANQLNEAIVLLKRMPCDPNGVTWMTLLSACCKSKNVEIGKFAFDSLMDIDKKNASAYVLMAHIYASRGMWEEQERLLEARIVVDTSKLPDHAYVYDEVGNMVKFVVGKEDFPEVKNKLEQLEWSYVSESYSNALDAEKEEALCGHSERRAVVYGILRIPATEPVRAFKSMRMCDSCHGYIKMISKLCERIIMVRDASRFHIMVNGNCSCGDYW